MASVETVDSNYSRYFEQNYCVSERESCEHCLSMRDYIQVLTNELKSMQLIVKILQDELKSKVPEPTLSGITTTCVNFKPQGKSIVKVKVRGLNPAEIIIKPNYQRIPPGI